MTTDPRRGVPSASTMHRLVACPPSHAMAQLLPPECREEESPEAASGTRIHAVLAGEAAPNILSADEAQTLDMCEAQAKALCNEWHSEDGEPLDIYHETRLGLTVLGRVVVMGPKTTATIRFSGQADMIVLEGDRALILDYKTGRGETAEAVNNAQLASLAALVSLWKPVQSVRVAIVQPWAGKPTVADYGPAELAKAVQWMHATLHAAEDAIPDQARAGEHCKFCRVGAAGRCPAARDAALQVVESVNPETLAGMDGETQRAAMFARALELPAERLAATLRGLSMVKRFVAAIEGAAKQRARDDEAFQRFFTLRQKQGRRTIANVRAVFERCHGHGVSAEDFTALCKIGLGDVKDILRKATGAKGKDLDAMHAAALEGFTEQGSPSYELEAVEGGGIA